MKVIKLFLIVFLVGVSSLDGFAQKSRYDKGVKLYNQFAYPEARAHFQKIVDRYGDNDRGDRSVVNKAKVLLAECFRHEFQPQDAVFWYKQIIDAPEAEDSLLLHYGMALKMIGKFDAAKKQFQEYAKLRPADTRGMMLLESIDRVPYLSQDPKIYKIKHLDINTANADFGAVFHKDGIVFTSERNTKYSEQYVWTNAPFLDLYYSERASDDPADLKKPQLFKGKANTWMHEGPVTFSDDGQTMYFTRNNYYKGKKKKDEENTINLKVFKSTLNGSKWGDIENLPFNSDDYSVAHPTLSKDGSKLYFSSDMPGGYGQTDIWVSEKEGDSWGTPENLGPEINTQGREMFPFIHEDGTLYFSSDILPGLGGLDVFATRDVSGSWTVPENLRSPVNTTYDDFAYIIDKDGEMGYFSSNRPESSVGKDDIYSFNKTPYMLEGEVFDCDAEQKLSGAVVELYENGDKVQEEITYEDGAFAFPISADKEYTIKVYRNNYEEKSVPVPPIGHSGSNVRVKLTLCPDDEPVCYLTGIVFEETWEYVNGQKNVVDKPVTGAVVTLKYRENGQVASTSVTDGNGAYSFNLESETDYVIFATKDDYLTSSKDISTKGRDCSAKLQKDLALNIKIIPIPEDRSEPIAILHIYYDFDRYYIKDEAKEQLDKIVQLMYNNPGVTLELGSHTDSRGTDSYNMTLSQNRANAAVEYIVSRGISKGKIVPRGYGESMLVNHCGDGVECSEEEHQLNRRTEFRILGYSGQMKDSQPRRYFGEGYYGRFDYNPRDAGGNLVGSTAKDSHGGLSDPTGATSGSNTGTINTGGSSQENSTTFFDQVDETVGGNNTNIETPRTFGPNGEVLGSAEFKIQVGAFRKPNLKLYRNLKGLGTISTESTTIGVTRILLGTYYDRTEVENLLVTVKNKGYSDAYIVTYIDGTRIQ